MRRAAAGLITLLAVSACQPNPRNEIAAIADVAMEEVARTAPGQKLCVDRVIAPWQPAADVRRVDPPAPPGYADLYARGAFRGGGGISGTTVGGVPVGAAPSCFDLRGPLVSGDRAMIEVHLPGTGLNVWERRTDGVWRVVTTTTSVYPG
ncbi:hypothetical protein KZ810_02470 [Sphingomonas sp. RHCKR47]|uniref:hypothetical protein n=1 Tax=Sphingomonas citricola TaxID=2862498 RepID=UPI001CA512E5|nr:hypothetical protein [Sphingomonas citricola]MBW6522351.1 hypothetical protein [Sphingomonas citricola]